MTEEDVVFPRAGSKPVPHLPVYKDGFKCAAWNADNTQCEYINRDLKRIQEHCRNEHGWENSRKRGRPSRVQQSEVRGMWEEGVWCQKFHGASRLGRLFEVRRGEDDNMGLPVGEDQDVQRAVAASLTQATADMEEAERKKRAQIEADTDRFEFSAWLDRAGWAKHLDGLSRAWLLTLVRKPELREKALNKVY